MGTLKAHLQQYGIRYFDSNDYWSWGAKQLGHNRASQINELREPLMRGTASDIELLNFYDFIAEPQIAKVVHSMKADAIRVSGDFISDAIIGRSRILDVGCSIGYLATWYARQDVSRKVIGIDVSQRSVDVATKKARELKVKNVRFRSEDIAEWTTNERFDAVVDAQTCSDLKTIAIALQKIKDLMTRDALFVSVSALGTPDDAKSFIDRISAIGLGVERFKFLQFTDLGREQTYLAIVARLGATNLNIDFEKRYLDIAN